MRASQREGTLIWPLASRFPFRLAVDHRGNFKSPHWTWTSATRGFLLQRGRSCIKEENMGLFDSLGGALKDVLGQAEAGALPSLVSELLAKTDLGSLQGIVNKLQESGLGNQVQSWLANGANLPVTADQLRAALGSEQVRQIAQQLGLPLDAAMKLLAEHLPTAVDQASPNGRIVQP
jgi:uncharacterized protein YidB (DUF937 family)